MNALASFAPVLTLSLGSLGYLLGGHLLERARSTALFAIVLVGAALYLTVGLVPSKPAIEHGFVINSFTQFFAVLACLGGLVAIIGTASSLKEEKIGLLSEYYFLMLTSLCGALIMIFASDFLTLFIGIEVASLALYCLCGSRIARRESSESAMKYFFLGCVSSAFLLFGIALWYGVTGSLRISPLSGGALSPMLVISFLFMVVGLAFKIGLAPFHLWVPDVYQGAPTSVTTFMSCVVKVAAFAVLFRLSISAFGAKELATGVFWFLSVAAMTLGNLAALQQRSVKRMLAYSSVAQAGYIMIGLVAFQPQSGALAASLFYLASYCAMTVGAFTVLSVLGPDADDVGDLKGLMKRSPLLATCMVLFFLGMAGLPPSMAGLMGKIYLLTGALSAKMYGLAIIGVINSAVACAYYFRVPVAILFQPASSSNQVTVSPASCFALSLCAAAVVGIGLFPEQLLVVANGVASAVGR